MLTTPRLSPRAPRTRFAMTGLATALALIAVAETSRADDPAVVASRRHRMFLEGDLGYGLLSVGVGPSDFHARGVLGDGRVQEASYQGSQLGFVRPLLHTIEINMLGGARNGPVIGMPMAFHWGSSDQSAWQETGWIGSGSTMYGFSMGLLGGWFGTEGPLTLRGTMTLGFRALLIPINGMVDVETGASLQTALVRGYFEPRLGADLRISRAMSIGVWTAGDLFHLGEYSYGTFLAFRTY